MTQHSAGPQPGPARRRGPLARVFIYLPLALPWLLAAGLMWYTADRAGPFPARGSILVAYRPDVVRALKAALLVCWFGMVVLLLYTGGIRRRTRPLGENDKWAAGIALSAPALAVFAGRLGVVGEAVVLAVLWAISLVLVSRERRLTLYAAMTALALCIPLLYVDMPVVFAAWRDTGSLRARDGRVYHLQRYQAGQGRTEALTEEVTGGP